MLSNEKIFMATSYWSAALERVKGSNELQAYTLMEILGSLSDSIGVERSKGFYRDLNKDLLDIESECKGLEYDSIMEAVKLTRSLFDLLAYSESVTP